VSPEPTPPPSQPESGIDLARAMLSRAKSDARARSGSRSGRRDRDRKAATAAANARRSGAGPDERDPQPVGQAVERLVVERGWQTSRAVGGVEGRWGQLVGPELSAHCGPESFEDGVLTVRADSTAWATQVRLLAGTLLARLNEDLGAGTVTSLRVLGPSGPSWKKGRLSVKGRGPRDTYG
jgi:predicted nucleic acid-binding Zn ribbon protein